MVIFLMSVDLVGLRLIGMLRRVARYPRLLFLMRKPILDERYFKLVALFIRPYR